MWKSSESVPLPLPQFPIFTERASYLPTKLVISTYGYFTDLVVTYLKQFEVL